MITQSNHKRIRFGIGEWFGVSFADMSQRERAEIANELLANPLSVSRACPPRSDASRTVLCNKAGGVCSIRQYVSDPSGVRVAPGDDGSLRTTCPNRFAEGGKIYRWIGERILGHSDPDIAAEIGFLEREQGPAASTGGISAKDDVGRIDHVLVHPTAKPMQWCALEVQAVYFSGPAMRSEFKSIADHVDDDIPFPVKIRRPDYRSSGPKRLMPQLQIKVPSLRRWGKKMAVLVDTDFFKALGAMDNVLHVSNSDIIWFVVGYEKVKSEYKIVLVAVQNTTLERAVEGLTAGTPISLETFEERLRSKIKTLEASNSATSPSVSFTD